MVQKRLRPGRRLLREWLGPPVERLFASPTLMLARAWPRLARSPPRLGRFRPINAGGRCRPGVASMRPNLDNFHQVWPEVRWNSPGLVQFGPNVSLQCAMQDFWPASAAQRWLLGGTSINQPGIVLEHGPDTFAAQDTASEHCSTQLDEVPGHQR